MNDVLEPRRIILRDVIEDMYDGQILSELVGESWIYMYLSVTCDCSRLHTGKATNMYVYLHQISQFSKINFTN